LKKVVTFGEVLMRLSSKPFHRFAQAKELEVNYGGSEANVAVSLSHFGFSAEHVTVLPQNDFGEAARAHLNLHQVKTDHVLFDEGRIGIYFLEHGADHRSSRVIYDRADSSFSNLKATQFNWDEILKDADWFHWSGITPAISNEAAECCHTAIKAAKSKGIKISADINYRRNLWQYGKAPDQVMPSLISQSDVVVGGVTDFQNCLNVSAARFEEACEKIQKQFPSISKFANTERTSVSASSNQLSGMVWSSKNIPRSKEYELTNIVDRVGSGDAFMAGLIYGWLSDWSDDEVVEFAMAACALKHTIPGDVNLVSVEEVKSVRNEINLGKLLR
jgi:2-dehydro-3-deoxygluconokinase